MIYLEPRSVFDAAIIGKEQNRLIYDYWIIIDQLMDLCEMEYIDAIDHMEYNIKGTSLKNWPLIVDNKYDSLK